MGGDSARRAGRAQEQQPRARGRDKQCAGPRGWTAQCKEKWGERRESWASPRGTSAKGLGKCVPGEEYWPRCAHEVILPFVLPQ